MDIFSVFMLLGGLAFFLYGMHVMSAGLEKMAGGSLERILKRTTSNPFKSLLLGAGITIAIQSSSALTVMLVGLVNSGIMELSQTVGVILGSNVGTTLTAWLLSLSGVESENVFLKMLKPENFSPIFALVGIIMIMVSKSTRKKDIGEIFVGFAVLMYGMELMKNSVSPLRDDPNFAEVLTAFNNPLLGVLVGAVFTGVIQSSAASVGILQGLSLTDGITFSMAFPIIMGQNIGTCVTSMISSIGVNRNAKRVSVIHIAFNLIGTIIFLVLYFGLNELFELIKGSPLLPFADKPISPVGIALAHSFFNIVTTIILFPFQKMLVKLAERVIKSDKSIAEDEAVTFLDERLLNTPSFAVSECKNMTRKMCRLAKDTLLKAIKLLDSYDTKTSADILNCENELDMYEDKLGSFLVKLSGKELSDEDSHEVSKMLHTIGDFERIGDHAVNLLKVAEEMQEKQITFSPEAQNELSVLTAAITDILTLTASAFSDSDLRLAQMVEPLEQVIDGLIADTKINHIKRLRHGNCTIELGFVLSDLLTNYERVSDHCSNVAVALIEVAQNCFDTHEYLSNIKHNQNKDFEALFEEYSLKYHIDA